MIMFFLKNLLILHIQMIAVYFSALSIILQGSRIQGFGISSATWSEVYRDQLEMVYNTGSNTGDGNDETENQEGPEQSI